MPQSKELRVQIRLYNNRLKEGREVLKMSQKAFAEAVGIGFRSYVRLECLSLSPAKDGEWIAEAQKLADFHCVDPEWLFPDSIQQIKVSRSEMMVDVKDVVSALSSGSQSPLEELEDKALEKEVRKLLSTLDPRKEDIIRRRLGFDGLEEATLGEIGNEQGVGKEAIRRHQTEAIKQLQRAPRSSKLRPFTQR